MTQKNTWLWAAAIAVLVLGAAWWLLSGRGETPAGDLAERPCGPTAPCPTGSTCCAGQCQQGGTCEAPPDDVVKHGEPASSRRRTVGIAGDATPTARPTSPVPVKVEPPAANTCEQEQDCDGNFTRCNTESGRCEEGPRSICIADVDCTGGRLCFRGSCTDTLPACRESDCQSNGQARCRPEFGECEKPGCGADDDCAGTRRCHPEKHYCVPCLENKDCQGAQYCDYDLCREPERCTSPDDCIGDRVCVTATGKCKSAPCAPDAYEPNNDKASATPLPPDGVLEDNHLCPADEDDHFALEMSDSATAIQVLYDASVGVMELRLYDPRGKEVGRYFDDQNVGLIAAWIEKPSTPSRYVVRMHYGGGHDLADGAIINYSIRRVEVPAGFCINDAAEPNDTFKQARELDIGPKQTYRLCHRDEDWFKLHLSTGQKLVLRPTRDVDPEKVNDDSPSAPDVEVYLNDPEHMVLRDTNPFPNKEIPFTATEDGDYYIRILPPLVDENSVYYFQLTPQ